MVDDARHNGGQKRRAVFRTVDAGSRFNERRDAPAVRRAARRLHTKVEPDAHHEVRNAVGRTDEFAQNTACLAFGRPDVVGPLQRCGDPERMCGTRHAFACGE